MTSNIRGTNFKMWNVGRKVGRHRLTHSQTQTTPVRPYGRTTPSTALLLYQSRKKREGMTYKQEKVDPQSEEVLLDPNGAVVTVSVTINNVFDCTGCKPLLVQLFTI